MPPRLRKFPDDSSRHKLFDALEHFGEESSYGRLSAVHPHLADLTEVFFQEVQGVLEPRGHNEIVQNMNLEAIAAQARAEQIAEYGSSWSDHRVRDPKDFRASRRTRWKQFQEWLTRPEDRVTKQGVLVICPKRLTPAVFEALDIPDPAVKGASKEDQLLVRAGAIPAIKARLEQLVPIRPNRDTRLFRVPDGEHEGWVIGTSHAKGRDYKTMFLIDYEAEQRRIEHAQAGYTDEVSKLTIVRRICERLHEKYLHWSDEEMREKLPVYLEAVRLFVNALQNVTNEDKLKMLNHLEHLQVLEDSRDRVNPSSKAARMAPTFKFISTRLQDVSGHSAQLQKDARKLDAVPTTDLSRLIHEAVHQIRQLPKDQQALGYDQLRTMIEREAPNAQFTPDVHFVPELVEILHRLERKREAQSRYGAAMDYVTLYATAKRNWAYQRLRELYRQVSVRPGAVDLKKVLRGLEDVQSMLADKSIGEPYTVRVEGYGDLYHLINSLHKHISLYLGMRTVGEDESVVNGPDYETLIPTQRNAFELLEQLRALDPVEFMMIDVTPEQRKQCDQFWTGTLDGDERRGTLLAWIKARIDEVDYRSWLLDKQ